MKGDMEQRHKTGDIGWEAKYKDMREGTKDVRQRQEKGTGKILKMHVVHQMIFAHAQPTRNQFSHMLNQQVPNFGACSPNE